MYPAGLTRDPHLLASMMNTRMATTQQDSLVTGCPGVRIVVRHLMSSDIDLNSSLRWASMSSWPLNCHVYSTSFITLVWLSCCTPKDIGSDYMTVNNWLLTVTALLVNPSIPNCTLTPSRTYVNLKCNHVPVRSRRFHVVLRCLDATRCSALTVLL